VPPGWSVVVASTVAVVTPVLAGGGSAAERIGGALGVVALVAIAVRLAPSWIRDRVTSMPTVARTAVVAVATAVVLVRVGIEVRPECYAGSDAPYRTMRALAVGLALVAVGCGVAALARRRWLVPLVVTPVAVGVLLVAVVGSTCVA